MSTKHLITVCLFLPLVTVSATAQAGSAISYKSYWPSETRRIAPLRLGTHADAYSALAYNRTMSPLEPAIAEAVGWLDAIPGSPKGR